MTYTKPLKGFSGTTLMGEQISAQDTATSRIGNDATEAFKAHKTIKTEAESRVMLTPFHAVKSALYGTFTEDAERTDPYCGDADGDTYTIRWMLYNGIVRTDSMKVGDTVVAPEFPEESEGCRFQEEFALRGGTVPQEPTDDLGIYPLEANFTLTAEMVENATTHDLMALPIYEC